MAKKKTTTGGMNKRIKERDKVTMGKIVELAVRNVVHGQPVKNLEALANPEALAQFSDRAELAS